jgi:hypothetical protein
MPFLFTIFILYVILYLKEKFKEMQAQANKNQKVIDDTEDDKEEKVEDSDDCEDDEEHEAQKPSRKIRMNFRGQEKKYFYLKTVKTVGELDKYGFKVL